jgi:uncharacterized protein YidB (DUF937 family)
MKRRIAIGAIAALAVVVAAVGLALPADGGLVLIGPVLAQERPPFPGPGQRGAGPLGPGGGPRAEGIQAMLQPVADLLGMTPAEIVRERREGHSLAEIAAARGVDQATLLQAVNTAARTRLDQAVADGRLTRGQADALAGVVREFAPDRVNRKETPGPAFGRFGPRQGPRAGQPGPGGPRGGLQAMVQPVADLLGMSPAEIARERQTGRSLTDIAAAHGVDQATLVQTISTAAKARLDEAVADGRLPQERAEAMAQRAQQFAERMVTQTGRPGEQLRERARERLRPDGGERPGPGERGPRGGEAPR